MWFPTEWHEGKGRCHPKNVGNTSSCCDVLMIFLHLVKVAMDTCYHEKVAPDLNPPGDKGLAIFGIFTSVHRSMGRFWYIYLHIIGWFFYGKLVGKYKIVPYGCYGFLNKEIRKKLNYGEGGIFTLLYTIIHEQATYCIWLQNGKLMVKWKPLKVVLGGAFSFRINTNIYRQKEFEAVHQCTNTYVHWGHQIDKGLLLHLVWLWTGNLRTWSYDGLIFRTWTSRYDFSCTVNPLGNYSQRMGCIKKGNGLTRLRLW